MRASRDLRWYTDAVDASIGSLAAAMGYVREKPELGFRGNTVSYLGSRYRIVIEFDPATDLLRGEFWDMEALASSDHLRVARFPQLLALRDPGSDWTAPSPLTKDAVLSTLRTWQSGLQRYANDVLAGGEIDRSIWVGVW